MKELGLWIAAAAGLALFGGRKATASPATPSAAAVAAAPEIYTPRQFASVAATPLPPLSPSPIGMPRRETGGGRDDRFAEPELPSYKSEREMRAAVDASWPDFLDAVPGLRNMRDQALDLVGLLDNTIGVIVRGVMGMFGDDDPNRSDSRAAATASATASLGAKSGASRSTSGKTGGDGGNNGGGGLGSGGPGGSGVSGGGHGNSAGNAGW